MASITVDSELMTNYVAAVPVAKGDHFMTILDESRRPMVITMSTGDKPELRLICKNASGNSSLLDLNNILSIPANAVVQTFHVKQSWSLTLYMCIAWRDQSTTQTSQLTVLKPFQPQDLRGSNTLPCYTGHASVGRVEKIFMNPVAKDDGLPDIYIAHNALDQAQQWGSDITTVTIDNDSWQPTHAMSPPENVTGIIDIATAVGPMGNGLLILYTNSNGHSELIVRFLRPNPLSAEGPPISYVKSIPCPAGTSAISSFLSPRGHSYLLTAASDGLRLLQPKDVVNGNTMGKLLYSDIEYMQGLRKLRISQDKSAVTAWFNTRKGELGYLRTTNDAFERGVAAQLLPEGAAIAFSAATTTATDATGGVTRQLLVVNDNSGNLALLEQSSDLGQWQPTPFYAPSNTTSTELKSYTVTVKTQLTDGQAARYGSILISVSSTVSVILNGTNVLLTQLPTWFDCDSEGTLNFMIPADSLSTQTLRFERCRDFKGNELTFKPVHYNPSSKVMQGMSAKLAPMQHGRDFANLKTQAGEALVSKDAGLSDDDLEAARQSLVAIGKAYNELPPVGGAVVAPSATVSADSSVLSAASTPSNPGGSPGKDLGDVLMDGWEWVKQKSKDAVEWIVRKAGDVWEFVCKIAGSVKKFVLNCVEKICEAASWVWNKIKVGWEKLCDFVGFIFNWEDILETKKSIKAVIHNTFGYAANKVLSINAHIDTVCNTLIGNVDSWVEGAPNKAFSNADASDTKVKESNTSTSSTWATERLKNGGAGANASAQTPDEDAEAQNLLYDVVVPAMKKIGEELEKVGDDMLKLFTGEEKITVQKMMKIGASVLKAGIEAMRGVLKSLVSIVAQLVLLVRTFGELPMEMPVFAWLYCKISGDQYMTLFDAISLIVAVPMTIFAKAITDKKPPNFADVDPTLMGQLIWGEAPQNRQADFDVFKAELAVGFTLTMGVVTGIKLIWSAFSDGAEKTLDKKKPGASSFFKLCGLTSIMVYTIISIPSSKKGLPGLEYRQWVSYVTIARGMVHVAFYFAGKNAAKEAAAAGNTSKAGDSLAEKAQLSIDGLAALAILALNVKVYMIEQDAATTWKDYDEESSEKSLVCNSLKTVSTAAYFTAFATKKSLPTVSAGATAVMMGTLGGVTVLQGMIFQRQYEHKLAPKLAIGPPF